MYNELYKAWKSEKESSLPGHLPKDFYRRAAVYLKGLQDESLANDPQTLQGRLLVREREMAGRLLDELRQNRLRKFLESAKNSIAVPEEGLADEEWKMAHALNESLTEFGAEAAEGEHQIPVQERTKFMVVRFLEEIPEIVGTDLKIYGPYKKEDVGSLPTHNAQALIRQGAAKAISVKGGPEVLEEEKLSHQQ